MADEAVTANPPPPAPPEPAAPPAPPKRRNPIWLLLIALALAVSHVAAILLGCGIGYLMSDWQQSSSSRRSVAIVPVTGFWQQGAPNADAKLRAFMDAGLPDRIARDIINNDKPQRLKVIATHETHMKQRPDLTPRQIGIELQVTAVLSGKLSNDGRVSFQLVAANSGELLWSNSFPIIIDQTGNPMLTAEAHQEIANSIRQKLTSR